MAETQSELAAILRQGIALFQQGQAVEAETLVADIQRRHPEDFNALHVLGIILAEGRDPARGVTLIRQALAQRPDFAPAWNNLGNGCRRLKHLAEALDVYGRAIALQPGFAQAHSNRGNVLLLLGRIEEALADFDAVLRLCPDMAEAMAARADALLALNRPADALAGYDMALARNPGLASAHNNRGNALRDLGRGPEALASYDTAIQIHPGYAEAFNNRGRVLVELRDVAAALQSFDRALALAPDYPAALSNRGNILLATGHSQAALVDHDRAIALEPGNFRVHNNRGNALLELKRLQEAQQSYARAIALAPDYAEAHWNRGISLLLVGDFERGLPEYQFRHRARFSLPQDGWPADRLWTGMQDLVGKTLLIHCEQGMGDTIQFCRYALMARSRGARVLIAPQAGLERLLASLGAGIEIVHGAVSGFDFHVPLLDMPAAFGTRLDTIPAPGAYLSAEPERVAYWHERLGGTGFKIGVCWQGNPLASSDIGRSFPVRLFEGIGKLPQVRLIALQKGAGLEQLCNLPPGMIIEQPPPPFDDGPAAFLDTAAMMMDLDLVITSDTAVAHLAGALGRPALIALKYVPDWRWLLDRSDTPWYPGSRIFRQHKHGDWTNVFSQITAHVAARLASR